MSPPTAVRRAARLAVTALAALALAGCVEFERETVVLVTSPDQGKHWTAPSTIDGSAGSHFFPWAAGGSAGKIAVIEYRSSTLRPNDPASVWYAAFLSIDGAVATVDRKGTHYVKTPRVTNVLLDSQPAHIGGICSFGIFCSVVPNADTLVSSAWLDRPVIFPPGWL